MTPTRQTKTFAELLPTWDTATLIEFRTDLILLIEAILKDEEPDPQELQYEKHRLVLVRAELAGRGYK